MQHIAKSTLAKCAKPWDSVSNRSTQSRTPSSFIEVLFSFWVYHVLVSAKLETKLGAHLHVQTKSWVSYQRGIGCTIVLKDFSVAQVVADDGKLFHSRIVLGKNDF